MLPAKLCRIEDGRDVPHEYGRVYFAQPCGDSRRLVIAASGDPVDLLLDLAGEFPDQQWYVMYVLLVERGRNEPGRYRSDPFKSHAELESFMQSFREFFEGDGRHHVWIGSVSGEGLLVYDQHNVIFAYGPLQDFQSVLKRSGYQESEFWFPAPHAHAFVSAAQAETADGDKTTPVAWECNCLEEVCGAVDFDAQ